MDDSAYLPDVPEDFDVFWAELSGEGRHAPLDFHRDVETMYDAPDHVVETFTFRGVKGEELHGWIAIPKESRHANPGFLWLAPYGRESLLPNEYGTRKGFVSLSFNFHGYDAFHQEAYTPTRGYFAAGLPEPRNWVFGRMFQNSYIAMRVMQALTEVDENRIAAAGLSQGAGLAIWLGAHCPIVKTVCADMPFLSAMAVTLNNPIYRYPLKELLDFADKIPIGMERVKFAVGYYDTLHQATRCQVPTLVSLGEKDPAVRPLNVEAVFEALPGDKRLLRYDWGHDWHPDMIENNRNWMLEKLG
ncbi:MAG: acetylxylan esterase [Fimbriimonadaceae bacterium]